MIRLHTFIPLFLLLVCSQLFAQISDAPDTEQLITSITKIDLPDFSQAHNPSIIDTDEGIVLTFRYLPKPEENPWISYIGVVLLNESLQPISKPQLLNTRVGNRTIPSQSEDARIFSHQGELYVIYNDNPHYINPSNKQRRDMYMAQLSYVGGEFVLSEPLKLYHQKEYSTQKWQKNWVPFEWHGALLMSYSLIPHEVLYTDTISGECLPFVKKEFANPMWQWKWGTLRGGTPAMLLDDQYLAFFHSSIVTSSEASNGVAMHHYYMGAYTFSNEPPFEITKVTPFPIKANGFYTQSPSPKRVIFPGGYVVRDKYLYLAYGKDDSEIWIATIDRQALNNALVPVSLLKN
jgi:predicted GH43/DUF377 family glycosyl hydrolase